MIDEESWEQTNFSVIFILFFYTGRRLTGILTMWQRPDSAHKPGSQQKL